MLSILTVEQLQQLGYKVKPISKQWKFVKLKATYKRLLDINSTLSLISKDLDTVKDGDTLIDFSLLEREALIISGVACIQLMTKIKQEMKFYGQDI